MCHTASSCGTGASDGSHRCQAAAEGAGVRVSSCVLWGVPRCPLCADEVARPVVAEQDLLEGSG